MDAATIRDIDVFYQQGLKAPLIAGQRGRDAIVDWDKERSPGEWIKLLRDRLRGLIADAIESRSHLQYTNIAGETVAFPLSTAVRLAAGKTCTAPLIDFLCSSAGFALAAQGQGVDTAAGRRIVRVKVLTVAESLAWFDGDEGVLKVIRPWDHDYVIAPLIRQFDIAGRVEERHLDIPHCFLVIICGLSGAVPKRIVYADPMADRRNGVDEAYARISDPDHPDHHLGINDIRATVVQTMNDRFPSRLKNLTADDFLRVFLPIDGYREEGMGVCLALAVAKIAQRPLEILAGPAYDRGTFNSAALARIALYDRRSNGSSLGQAMLVALQSVIKASQVMVDDAEKTDMADYGMPKVTELFLLARLRPKGFMCFWEEYLRYEADGRYRALYYMLYQEILV